MQKLSNETPIFTPNSRKAKYFMPHFPIFTGNVKSYNSQKVKFLLNKLENPEKKLKNVIHVVGTNGKGSTCSYLYFLLKEHGFKVNVYTSPHLYSCNERINIDGSYITDADLFYFSERIRILCIEHKLDLTIFESLTIVSILAFSGNDADFNIFEAGMGGANDATNIFEEDQLTCVLLTSVSLDHTKFLGETTYEITKNKLGVLKPFTPLIIFPCDSEVLRAILEEIIFFKSPPFFYGRDYNITKFEYEDGKNMFEFCFQKEDPLLLPCPNLLGEHQIFNLSVALTALKAMNVSLDLDKTSKAILSTKWAGRLERVLMPELLNLLPQNTEVWFDGAHNSGGALAIAAWLKQTNHNYFNIIILSKTRGTNVKDFIKPFGEVVDFGICIKGVGEIFAEHTEVLAEGFKVNNISYLIAKDLFDALKSIADIKRDKEKKIRIIITGSLYLARDISFIDKLSSLI